LILNRSRCIIVATEYETIESGFVDKLEVKYKKRLARAQKAKKDADNLCDYKC
jgi:hypothetical protein